MKFKLPVEAFAKSASVVIYGTGDVANQYMDQIEEMGAQDQVAYFADSYPSDVGVFKGRPVLSLKQLQDHPDRAQWTYIVASYLNAHCVVDELRNCGVAEENIVMPAPASIERDKAYFPLHRDSIQHIVMYPYIEEETIRKDIMTRLNWYLPNLADLKIFMPEHQVQIQAWRGQLEACDLVLVWDKERLGDDDLQSCKVKTACVDPKYTDTQEIYVYVSLYYRTTSYNQRKEFLSQSISNFARMQEQFKKYDLAYVFGSGPSLEKVWDMEFEPSVKIICNSIIKNAKLINRLNADIFVFSDGLWFSHTSFGAEFRQCLIAFLQNKNRYCIVPEMYAPLLLAHFPDIRDQLIGIPVSSSSMNIPTTQSFSVKQTYNVMTRLGITTASSLAKSVYILGCDGRSNVNDLEWKHSKSATLVVVENEDLQKVHSSSLVSHDPPVQYSERHHRFMEELLQHGERQGITYRSLAPSYIPALAKRQLKSEE
ncbi:hypothetical protein [Cohnella soli]|uniref:Uncharacterized protein n=1 Tax=Cohnella soli TaxID=425005 RepID=A0ABW0HMJ6_9BACL